MYVDDLMLSGPTEFLKLLWDELAPLVEIEEPESLDRFLGRHHEHVAIEQGVDDSRERAALYSDKHADSLHAPLPRWMSGDVGEVVQSEQVASDPEMQTTRSAAFQNKK